MAHDPSAESTTEPTDPGEQATDPVPPAFKPPTVSQARFWFVVLVVALVVLWFLSSVLTPFVAGMAIAYLLHPTVTWMGTRMPRWAAVSVLMLCVFVALFAIGAVVVPLLAGQVVSLAAEVPTYVRATFDRFAPMIEQARQAIGGPTLEDVGDQVGDYAGQIFSWLADIFTRFVSGGAAVVEMMMLIFITPIVAFYLLMDWPMLTAAIKDNLPLHSRDRILAVLGRIDETLSAFVRGQAMVCLILGIFYAFALSFYGLNFGILVGIIAGLITFIPYVGSAVGLFLSVTIALFQYDTWIDPAIVAGIFLFGQLIENNFITPKLVGDSVGLHPVWVMFALLAGGSMFGFTGVLLGLPVAAVIGVLVRFSFEQYRMSVYFLGHEPETKAADPDNKADETD